MTVYLGSQGEIELKRIFDGGALSSQLDVGDVNVTEKRFSFDFEHGQLLTGDQIEITATDGTALDFVDSYTQSSIKRFIHVDELDGIRMYATFAEAVSGGKTNAVTLAAPGNSIPIKVVVQSITPRVLAQVTSYEVNTERETVDTTTLSDEFRSRVNTLISGSGRISAFWEYTGNRSQEVPHYLLELAHRTSIGSNFVGRFYLKRGGYCPDGADSFRSEDQIWWQVEGIITNAAVQFAPDSTVEITADFITTGKLQLKMQTEFDDALLQEDSGDIRLDQDSGAKLLLQQDV
jgi:hypothetical protein|tara:strand:+ start:857 stop:1729 length:873 start_codon:yes stop_codon:yes gene_type:complete